jgi:hypothetical protein
MQCDVIDSLSRIVQSGQPDRISNTITTVLTDQQKQTSIYIVFNTRYNAKEANKYKRVKGGEKDFQNYNISQRQPSNSWHTGTTTKKVMD